MRRVLTDLGVSRIKVVGTDTYRDGSLLSYRRDGPVSSAGAQSATSTPRATWAALHEADAPKAGPRRREPCGPAVAAWLRSFFACEAGAHRDLTEARPAGR